MYDKYTYNYLTLGGRGNFSNRGVANFRSGLVS